MRLQSLKLLRLTFYVGGDAFTKNRFDLDLGISVTRNVAQYPLHHVTYAATKFEATYEIHLQENTLFDIRVNDT